MPNVLEYLKETSQFETMTTNEIFNEILDSYMGTSDMLAEEDFEWLDHNGQLINWDSFIFKCNCGWFCDVAEQHENPEGGDAFCDDCKPEEE